MIAISSQFVKKFSIKNNIKKAEDVTINTITSPAFYTCCILYLLHFIPAAFFSVLKFLFSPVLIFMQFSLALQPHGLSTNQLLLLR